MLADSFSAAPGLHRLRGFLQPAERQLALQRALSVSHACRAAASLQPLATPSSRHNINARAEYKPISIDLDGRTLSAEHFESYGDGHELTYFRGANNIPEIIPPAALTRAVGLQWVQEELRSSRARKGRPVAAPISWRLTLNRYPPGESYAPGFPWHRDLHANGAVSLILGLGGEPGTLQFAEDLEAVDGEADGIRHSDHSVPPEGAMIGLDAPSPVEEVELMSGDLLVLTGKARWGMLHRVLRNRDHTRQCSASGQQERLSLVYGCW